MSLPPLPDTPPPAGLDGLPKLDSRELFRHGDEILIEHDGALYRLRRTRNGKLILTK